MVLDSVRFQDNRKIVRGHFNNDLRVLYALRKFHTFFAFARLLKLMVARDGIEPPTPAFSEPLTVSQKWFEINQISLRVKSLWRR